MGAWGPAIYSDDLACDIRDDFKELIGDGHNSEQATILLEKEYKNKIELDFDIYKDKYWQSFNRFNPN